MPVSSPEVISRSHFAESSSTGVFPGRLDGLQRTGYNFSALSGSFLLYSGKQWMFPQRVVSSEKSS